MYQTNQSKRALLLGAASVLAIGIAAPAMAQDSSVETVVVTGSRIPQTGLYSSSPVSVIGQQELKLEGTVNIETALRELPMSVADVDNGVTNNGSGGESLVDLRGLGANRTLVLVDGKRLMPTDTAQEVDISQIPPALIDHTEILTGGASAVYGSDAIAGVVNFILRKDFEGAEVDAQYGQTDHNDGGTTDVTGIMGFNSGDGKGNVTLYAEYQNRQPILQGDRSYGEFALNSPIWDGCGTPVGSNGLCHGGSGSSAQGLITPAAGPFAAQGFFPDSTTTATLTPCGAKGTTQVGCPKYNFAPANYYQTPNTRYSFGAEGHYEVSKALDFYTRLTFSNSQVTEQLAPTPIVSTFSVNYANPFLSDSERGQLFACFPGCAPDALAKFSFGRRLVENGDRIDTFERQTYQIVVGAKGDLGDGWSYDFSGQYGRSVQTQHLTGDAKFAAFGQGLIATGTATAPVCVDPSNGCVPINIFTQGAISKAAVDFFTLGMTAYSVNQQWDVQGSVVGDLGAYGIKSPWAKNPVAVSFGGEYRQEQASFIPDDNLATGNDLGFGQVAPVSGSYNVSEGFTEVRIPLLEDLPFAELLQVEGAYRYSSYNLAGSSSTYKYSAEWQPIDDFRIRGSVERAVRAPNIGELFSAQSVSANPGTDPCSAVGQGAGHFATTAALCEATGVPAGSVFGAALNCFSGQCTARTGGNPNLKPEVADTKSLGVVFTPTFLDGFTATADYYNIKVDGFITGLPLATVLAECYNPALNTTQSASNPFCSLVHRNTEGQIFGEPVPPGGDVTTLASNIGTYQTKGYDFEANYAKQFSDFGWDAGMGGFAINYQSTWQVLSNFQSDPTSNVNKCDGLYGDICPDSAPTPRYKHKMRFTWISSDDDVTISLLWRHISATEFDEMKFSGAAATSCGFNFCDPVDDHIPSFDYFDLSGTWAVTPKVELSAGVSNIFNKNPPLVSVNIGAASVDSGNTFPGTYDTLGRQIFVGATVKF